MAVSSPTEQTQRTRWSGAWLRAAVAVISLRLVLGLVMGLTWIVARPYLPVEALAKQGAYGALPAYTSVAGEALLGVWPRWDAVHYLNLALRGYFGVSVGDSAYYPLYPGLTWLLAPIFKNEFVLAGLIVSSLSALVALACLYHLTESYADRQTAHGAVVALACYPTALFLVAPYTESLFLALTLAVFVGARARRWWLAGLLGFLASLTRGPGMFTAAALLPIALDQARRGVGPRSWRQALSVVAGLALPVAGGLAFLGWRAAVGFPPPTVILERYSGLTLVDPVRGLIAAVVQWRRVLDLPTTLDVVSALLFVGLTLVMIISRRWRRPEWVIFVTGNLLFMLSKQSFVASSLQSASRYVLVLFPIFMMLGQWLARQRPRVQIAYVSLSTFALLLLSALYALWFFIG